MQISFHRLVTLPYFLLFFLSAQAQYPGIDVLDYSFELTLSDANNVISGNARIAIQFTESGKRNVTLDLVKKGDAGGMEVSKVTRGKKNLSFKQEAETLEINLNNSTKTNQIDTFNITYAGVPADGMIISANEYGDRTFFGDNWPNRANHWLPTFDHPADKATVAFKVTAPDHYEVIGTGQLMEETYLPQGQKFTHWKSTVALPTKVMVIGAARFAIQHVGSYKNIPVSSWVYPQNREEGFHDYAIAMQVLEFMETHIGAYPYAKLANVQSKTRYGGMENASNIFYSESSVTGKRESEQLIAHEIAHQWFGNSASERDWNHIWLSEGFATYFTHLYVEETYGKEEMIKGMLKDRATVFTFAKLAPNSPIVDPRIKDLNQLLSANTYQKASWVLHMLRFVVGDEAFWEGIKLYYETYKLENALTEDFQKVMENVSGKDLDVFFKKWIYSPGWPVFKGDWKYDPKIRSVVIDLQQTQEGKIFQMPLEVGVYMRNEKESVVKRIQLTQKEQTITIPTGQKPELILLDPNSWMLKEVDFKPKE